MNDIQQYISNGACVRARLYDCLLRFIILNYMPTENYLGDGPLLSNG